MPACLPSVLVFKKVTSTCFNNACARSGLARMAATCSREYLRSPITMDGGYRSGCATQ